MNFTDIFFLILDSEQSKEAIDFTKMCKDVYLLFFFFVLSHV